MRAHIVNIQQCSYHSDLNIPSWRYHPIPPSVLVQFQRHDTHRWIHHADAEPEEGPTFLQVLYQVHHTPNSTPLLTRSFHPGAFANHAKIFASLSSMLSAFLGFEIDMSKYGYLIDNLIRHGLKASTYAGHQTLLVTEVSLDIDHRLNLSRNVVKKDLSEICAICYEEKLNPGYDVLCMPLCMHAFHDGCIMQWLRKARHCPVCRRQLPTGTMVSYLLHHVAKEPLVTGDLGCSINLELPRFSL